MIIGFWLFIIIAGVLFFSGRGGCGCLLIVLALFGFITLI